MNIRNNLQRNRFQCSSYGNGRRQIVIRTTGSTSRLTAVSGKWGFIIVRKVAQSAILRPAFQDTPHPVNSVQSVLMKVNQIGQMLGREHCGYGTAG